MEPRQEKKLGGFMYIIRIGSKLQTERLWKTKIMDRNIRGRPYKPGNNDITDILQRKE